jgi:N-acetylglutamate synthase-like GNAT family acetyltransferase
LIERPLYKRITSAAVLEIIPYEDTLAQAFYDLNEAWISSMFKMEMADEAVLSDPRGKIIERGGHILFVKAADGAVIGAGALQPVGEDGDFELTKMAVDESRRGEKAGEFLLAALIEKARSIGVKRLHLLTNTDCRAAIHLYEKLGFTHDANIMAQFGAKYDRADVAMRYPI